MVRRTFSLLAGLLVTAVLQANDIQLSTPTLNGTNAVAGTTRIDVAWTS